MNKKPYPSDVGDEEWAFMAPYLVLMREDAPQRDYSLREVLNGLRWIIRSGAQWGMMPTNLSPWYTVYQQAQRWMKADLISTDFTSIGPARRRWPGPASSLDLLHTPS